MKINKNKMVITIDSELGSRGDMIGKELSRILHIPCYGTEILDRASEISKIPAELMHRYDGRTVRAAYDLLADSEASIRIAPAAAFITAQVFAARQYAAAGSCILVDRHASSALEGFKNHIRIFVHADIEDRAKELARKKGMSEKAAIKALKKADRAYQSYYKGNNKNWGNANGYDLTVNASGSDPRHTAATIVALLETITGLHLHKHTEQKAG